MDKITATATVATMATALGTTITATTGLAEAGCGVVTLIPATMAMAATAPKTLLRMFIFDFPFFLDLPTGPNDPWLTRTLSHGLSEHKRLNKTPATRPGFLYLCRQCLFVSHLGGKVEAHVCQGGFRSEE